MVKKQTNCKLIAEPFLVDKVLIHFTVTLSDE